MSKTTLTKKAVEQAMRQAGGIQRRAAEKLGVPETTLKDAVRRYGLQDLKGRGKRQKKFSVTKRQDEWLIQCDPGVAASPEEAMRRAGADPAEWEIIEVTSEEWTTTGRISTTEERPGHAHRHQKYDTESYISTEWKSRFGQFTNHLMKIRIRRKSPHRMANEALLEEIRKHSVKLPKLKRRRRRATTPRRALEVCIMDPHLGLEAFRPSSDEAWDMDQCEQFFLGALEDLLVKAAPYMPLEEIVWVFGNDFLHSDNIWIETTQGTLQPESITWHHLYERGKKLAIAAADRLKLVAPLRIIQISGNHDRQSSFTLGHVLDAYFHRDPNVTVEVSPDPYKFWQYGVNLIGLDHGHSKKLERLAALMANEMRTKGWAEARYCEWHLGDQHRKGSGRPTILAEQGVGIEFLTGLTPANEWHRIKTFNWQPRGAVAYVWDFAEGPVARLHYNIDSYTGRPMGK